MLDAWRGSLDLWAPVGYMIVYALATVVTAVAAGRRAGHAMLSTCGL